MKVFFVYQRSQISIFLHSTSKMEKIRDSIDPPSPLLETSLDDDNILLETNLDDMHSTEATEGSVSVSSVSSKTNDDHIYRTEKSFKTVQPVKSPVSNPPLVMRFAEAGWANDRAAAAVSASRIFDGAFITN